VQWKELCVWVAKITNIKKGMNLWGEFGIFVTSFRNFARLERRKIVEKTKKQVILHSKKFKKIAKSAILMTWQLALITYILIILFHFT
jgi:hypothetical protein